MHRKIYVIASEIVRDWKNPNYAARPYLQAMQSIENIGDSYFEDSAKLVVLYFLSNAGTWRGETAKWIKAELKEMVK